MYDSKNAAKYWSKRIKTKNLKRAVFSRAWPDRCRFVVFPRDPDKLSRIGGLSGNINNVAELGDRDVVTHDVVRNHRAAGVESDTTLLEDVSGLVKSLQEGIAGLGASIGDGECEAAHYCESVVPAMSTVRESVDALEGLVADDLWPLPTYQEMLFIR